MMRADPPWSPLVNSNDRVFLSSRGLHHDQRGPGKRAAPERDLREVADRRTGEGRTGGRPFPAHDETERCSTT
jgi:hypothetical protein